MLHLQEKRRNSLKDFLNVAGPMGVTHFMMLSKTEGGPYLRVARTPQGPTLTFKIVEYSLAADIAQSQAHPRCPQELFKNSPLVIFYLLLSSSPDYEFVMPLLVIQLLFFNQCHQIRSNNEFQISCRRLFSLVLVLASSI